MAPRIGMTEAAAAPATANPVFIKLRRDGVHSGMFIDPALPNPQIEQHSIELGNLILSICADSSQFSALTYRFIANGSRFGPRLFGVAATVIDL